MRSQVIILIVIDRKMTSEGLRLLRVYNHEFRNCQARFGKSSDDNLNSEFNEVASSMMTILWVCL